MWCSSGFCSWTISLHSLHYSVKFNYPKALDHHLYAVDTQIYISLTTPETNHSLNQLWDFLQDIFHWMNDSKLKLNTDKTEFLIIGTKRQRDKIECFFPTPILDQNFTPTTLAQNLGITFDTNFYIRTACFSIVPLLFLSHS